MHTLITQFLDAALDALNPVITYFSANANAYNALIFSLLTFIVVLFFFSIRKKKPVKTANLLRPDQKDIHAIAGDDVVSTQLDLAKAYIEMNQKKIAKEMLNLVMKQGSSHQKTEARLLIQSL